MYYYDNKTEVQKVESFKDLMLLDTYRTLRYGTWFRNVVKEKLTYTIKVDTKLVSSMLKIKDRETKWSGKVCIDHNGYTCTNGHYLIHHKRDTGVPKGHWCIATKYTPEEIVVTSAIGESISDTTWFGPLWSFIHGEVDYERFPDYSCVYPQGVPSVIEFNPSTLFEIRKGYKKECETTKLTFTNGEIHVQIRTTDGSWSNEVWKIPFELKSGPTAPNIGVNLSLLCQVLAHLGMKKNAEIKLFSHNRAIQIADSLVMPIMLD